MPEQDNDHKHDRHVRVEVFVPSQVDGKSFTWLGDMLVSAAAAEAAAEFGIQGWTPSFQNDAKKVLDRNQSLLAQGVDSGDSLELVDAGGGV